MQNLRQHVEGKGLGRWPNLERWFPPSPPPLKHTWKKGTITLKSTLQFADQSETWYLFVQQFNRYLMCHYTKNIWIVKDSNFNLCEWLITGNKLAALNFWPDLARRLSTHIQGRMYVPREAIQEPSPFDKRMFINALGNMYACINHCYLLCRNLKKTENIN